MSRRLRAIPIEGKPRRTFIDAVLAGEAAWFDLDDWVERWHNAETELQLHEWLGLSFAEYGLLGSGDRNLAAILYARRRSVPLEQALEWYRHELAAARDQSDPQELQELLVREGLVGG